MTLAIVCAGFLAAILAAAALLPERPERKARIPRSLSDDDRLELWERRKVDDRIRRERTLREEMDVDYASRLHEKALFNAGIHNRDKGDPGAPCPPTPRDSARGYMERGLLAPPQRSPSEGSFT